MDNFLQLEDEIVARLKVRLAELRPAIHVMTAADLAGAVEEKQLAPAVHVVFQNYRPTETRPDGRIARVEQTWLVVVATKNVRATKTGDAARSAAGLLARQVLLALQGWQPPSATKPLLLAPAPNARYGGGHQYLPLALTAEIVLKSQP